MNKSTSQPNGEFHHYSVIPWTSIPYWNNNAYFIYLTKKEWGLIR